MFEFLKFGPNKNGSPKNRPEDIDAARDLAATDPVLQNYPEGNKEVIDKAETDPENSQDIGETLAQRVDAINEAEQSAAAGRDRAEAIGASTYPQDNNERV